MKEALGIFQEAMGRISVEGSWLRAGGCLLQSELYDFILQLQNVLFHLSQKLSVSSLTTA